MPRSVDVRLEDAAFFGELAALGQREHLEAAAVGQDGPVPRGEGVEAARTAQDVQAGPQVEVVGIAQDDLGVYVFSQVLVVDAFDRTDRSHRHEDGRLDRSVVGGDPAAAGLRGGVPGQKFEFHFFTKTSKDRQNWYIFR